MYLLFIIFPLLLFAVDRLSRLWFRWNPPSPAQRERLLTVFIVAMTLMFIDIAVMALFLASGFSASQASLLLNSLVVVFMLLVLLIVLLGPTVWRDLMDLPAQLQGGQSGSVRPSRRRLDDLFICVGGFSVAVAGVAVLRIQTSASYQADLGYGTFSLGLCIALVGLAELLQTVSPGIARSILCAAGVCALPVLWFGTRFLIGQFW